MRYALLFALSIALLATGPAQAQIKQEVSDATGTERLVSEEMQNLVTRTYPGHASFRAEYEHRPEDDPIWRLSFYGFTNVETDMSAAETVQMQVDGQTITPLRVESNTRELDGSLLEIKHADFTRADFEQIATAERVAASIGPAQFELTRPTRADLRRILERVPEENGPPTASSTDSDSTQ